MFDLLDSLFDALDKFLDDLDDTLEEITVDVSDKDVEHKRKWKSGFWCGTSRGFFCDV